VRRENSQAKEYEERAPSSFLPRDPRGRKKRGNSSVPRALRGASIGWFSFIGMEFAINDAGALVARSQGVTYKFDDRFSCKLEFGGSFSWP
jgi:hypothetical protein